MKSTAVKLSPVLFLFLILNTISIGQVPEGFNYMAVARDPEGVILANKTLIVTLGILSDTDPVYIVWEEEHEVKTNEFGMFQLVIGDPLARRLETSNVDFFSDILWHLKPMYLRTLIDGEEMGTVQLFSVPYAMVAKTALSGIGNPFFMNSDTIVFSNNIGIGTSTPNKALLSVMGDDTASEDALFEVKRKDGETLFAVYNQGVRINIPLIDNVKGIKGGFAIGGFSTGKGVVQDLFSLNKDSVRIYLDKTPDLTKGKKGGFAIGGFDVTGKGADQEYLSVTPDSTRIYVKEGVKGLKGGFAIGSFNGAKGNSGNFLDLTTDNYLIGHESGLKIDGGLYNSFMGYQAGYNTTTGSNNYIIGYRAGYTNTTGYSNIFIGDSAGFKNTSGYFNSFIGNWSGFSNTTGFKNVTIGFKAGYKNTSGRCNVFVGPDAGRENTTAWYNTFIGIGAGYNTTSGGYNSYYGINSGYAMTSGSNNAYYGSNSGYWFDGGSGNTFIGAEAGRGGPDNDPADPPGYNNTVLGSFSGYFLENASDNVLIGYSAGSSLHAGSGNVFIGNTAGSEETGSNKLYITNRTLDGDDNPLTPMIYGDFSTNKLGINTMALTRTMNVGGDIGATGNIYATTVVANVSGNVNGNVTGDLSGDVTGNLSGNVNGDLSGNVNGVEMGKIFLVNDGEIQNLLNGAFLLLYNRGDKQIVLVNKSPDFSCTYWYRRTDRDLSETDSGTLVENDNIQIMPVEIKNELGFEIHFGESIDGKGYCSVWIQYLNGIVTGHYMKY